MSFIRPPNGFLVRFRGSGYFFFLSLIGGRAEKYLSVNTFYSSHYFDFIALKYDCVNFKTYKFDIT